MPIGPPMMRAEPASGAPGDLIWLHVEGALLWGGGLRADLESMDGQHLFTLVANRDLTDGTSFGPGQRAAIRALGVDASRPYPVRIPAVSPGRYRIRRTFRVGLAPVDPRAEHWHGIPEENPYLGPTYERSALVVAVNVVSPGQPTDS